MFDFFELFFVLGRLENRVSAVAFFAIWVRIIRFVSHPANLLNCVFDATKFQNVLLLDLVVHSLAITIFESPHYYIHILVVDWRAILRRCVLRLKFEVESVIDKHCA